MVFNGTTNRSSEKGLSFRNTVLYETCSGDKYHLSNGLGLKSYIFKKSLGGKKRCSSYCYQITGSGFGGVPVTHQDVPN